MPKKQHFPQTTLCCDSTEKFVAKSMLKGPRLLEIGEHFKEGGEYMKAEVQQSVKDLTQGLMDTLEEVIGIVFKQQPEAVLAKGMSLS